MVMELLSGPSLAEEISLDSPMRASRAWTLTTSPTVTRSSQT